MEKKLFNATELNEDELSQVTGGALDDATIQAIAESITDEQISSAVNSLGMLSTQYKLYKKTIDNLIKAVTDRDVSKVISIYFGVCFANKNLADDMMDILKQFIDVDSLMS